MINPPLPLLESEHIWVADDCDYVRRVLLRGFKRSGRAAQVRFFSDGNALVQHAAKVLCGPNVLLLDIEMPGMCGLDALMRLRTFSAFARTTVIVFSASDNADHVAEAYNRGAQLFLRKPGSLVKFETITKLLTLGAESLRSLPFAHFPDVSDLNRALLLGSRFTTDNDGIHNALLSKQPRVQVQHTEFCHTENRNDLHPA